MPRRARHEPLRVLLNNRLVGHLRKEASGAIEFRYDQGWLEWEHALPVSLSMPLREDAFRGQTVTAVFDNLLPDSDALRRRIADRVGAAGIDAWSLLAAIGRDCVGALQFLAGDEGHDDGVSGEAIDGRTIERLLKGLAQAPLGLTRDDDFRISIAGAQEKTALLRHAGKWLRPHGTTATTHILKSQIGTLPNGIDLSNSVENEYYCLRLAAAFGLPVSNAAIMAFGKTTALVVERFDRRWTRDGRLLRVPQEDCCQALAVPPTRKYQSEGGPDLKAILNLLRGSDDPAADQAIVFKAQILFWLIGATDGHAGNFSIFLGPGGRYRLTPLYDILTAQPSLDAGQIRRRQMKLAMPAGTDRHYHIDEIVGRHFVQTAEAAGLPKTLIHQSIAAMADNAQAALATVERDLPRGFPGSIHDSVKAAVIRRLDALKIS
jgi:serine/threonine-protein kinase HipA